MLTYMYTQHMQTEEVKQRMEWLSKETNTHSSIDFYCLLYVEVCVNVCLSVQYCSNAVGPENLFTYALYWYIKGEMPQEK